MPLLQTALTNLQGLQGLGLLVARLVVGVLFFLTGYAKLFRSDAAAKMLQTLQAARIPFPRITAVGVSAVEFICGALLVIGALTPLASLMLAADMAVAITTVNARHIRGTSALDWLSKFLYLPQVLYVVILLGLLFSGPGWLSVDQALFATWKV
jgi:putative oxidoreductase